MMNKNITGKAGELVIVISNKSWDDIPGKLLRQTLAQPQLSLPQDEPLFDLIPVPHEAFKEIFQTTRNIVQTRISPIVENPGVTFTDNIWAYPQATVQINARNNEEFEKLFTENSDKIIGYFLKAERDRMTVNYHNYHDKAVRNTLDQKYDILLTVPPGFQISQENENFVWLRYETPEISQAIFVYWFPYTSDSTFTLNYLLNKRDSILRANVPGPTEGSFMATERRVDPLFQVLRHNRNYAAEIRGLWRVQNDFMGGPFILLAELDAYRQRVVVADGYVYAPSKDKRNFIRQVEAMVYSMAFNDQDKNDRLNSQAQMGN
ncbi:MAG: DUF4837 family protein [Bacteroidota bacterium]